MHITKPYLISKRIFTYQVPMAWLCLNYTLTLGTSLFMYNHNNVHKMEPEERCNTARSAISKFKTKPCLKVKGRL